MSKTYYDDDVYAGLDKDDRIGRHQWLIADVTHDYWPSGDPRTKITGKLLTAASDQNGSKPRADLTISPLPSAEVVKAESGGWDRGKRKAIAAAHTNYKAFANYYQKSPDPNPPEGLTEIQPGDVFYVQTGKSPVDANTGKGGYIRVIVILQPTGETREASDIHGSVPF